jgi:hypothetical protein
VGVLGALPVAEICELFANLELPLEQKVIRLGNLLVKSLAPQLDLLPPPRWAPSFMFAEGQPSREDPPPFRDGCAVEPEKEAEPKNDPQAEEEMANYLAFLEL